MPQTRKKFWQTKIERNKERDKKVTYHYRKDGWKVIRIWEHKIKKIDFVIEKIKIKLF